MRWILGLLAASLPGLDGPANNESPNIRYDVKVLEMKGLDWRSTFYAELQPVARRGAATVWTAPQGTVARLAARADKLSAAPSLTCLPATGAIVHETKSRAMIAEMARHADGPVNHASYVAFQPRVENATEGYSLKLSGRKIDQGVLARVAIRDSQIIAVHTVSLTEARERKAGGGDKGADRIKTEVQVPEFADGAVEGEWLIPNEGVLVVSLGVHTVADGRGQAVVRERLALVEARAIEGKPALPAYILPSAMPLPNVQAALAAAARPTIPLPAPVAPSRALPQGLNAVGTPVPLPPLPDEQMTPPTALPGSSEPCATPQTKGSPVGDPIPAEPAGAPRDPGSRKAGYVADPGCCDIDGDCCAAAPPAAEKAEASSTGRPRTFTKVPTHVEERQPVPEASSTGRPKTFTFRIPLKADFVIEVHASTRSMPFAGAPAPPLVDGPKGKD